MKLILSASIIVMSTLTLSVAHAQPINQTALSKTQYVTATVAQAKNLKDDSKVTVTGQIVRSLGNEKYEFKDKTGSMTVDIDNEKWNGKPVNANTTITLIGEIDEDHFPKKTVEIDVDEVRL